MAHRACGDDSRLDPDKKIPVHDVSYPHAVEILEWRPQADTAYPYHHNTYKEQLLRAELGLQAGPSYKLCGFLVFQSFFINVH